jgi:hypothetical protein
MCCGFKARIRITGIRRWRVELERKLEVVHEVKGRLWEDQGIDKTPT